jgi:hypothetical protein
VLKRYLTVVGLILIVLVGLGVWLKPPLDKMREGVDKGLRAYAAQRLQAGDTMPTVSHVASHDWLVAVSHSARVGEDTFYCFGAFRVTFCQHPN